MTEPSHIAVIHQSVSTSKELATKLQEDIAKAQNGLVHLSTLETQAIASQLRITANLVSNLLEENSRIMDQVQSLVDRLNKE